MTRKPPGPGESYVERLAEYYERPADQELVASAKLGAATNALNLQGLAKQNWGQKYSPADLLAAAGGQLPLLSVGPFPTPTPIRIDSEWWPIRPPTTTATDRPRLFSLRLTQTFDGDTLTTYFPAAGTRLPRVVVANALQLDMVDIGTMSSLRTGIAYWASVDSGAGAWWPTPIAIDLVQMGVGVAVVDLIQPPRQATHVQVTLGSLGSQRVKLRQAINGSMLPGDIVLGGEQGLTASPPVPYFPDMEIFRLTRAVSGSADDYLVAWCK